VLRAVVLALHDDAGRHVGDADRRVGLVDVLAAGARGAEGVGAQVGGLISTSIESSISGYTYRLAKLVWRPPEESKGDLRTRRCTPVSVRRKP
jgi:hypothetical protein